MKSLGKANATHMKLDEDAIRTITKGVQEDEEWQVDLAITLNKVDKKQAEHVLMRWKYCSKARTVTAGHSVEAQTMASLTAEYQLCCPALATSMHLGFSSWKMRCLGKCLHNPDPKTV